MFWELFSSQGKSDLPTKKDHEKQNHHALFHEFHKLNFLQSFIAQNYFFVVKQNRQETRDQHQRHQGPPPMTIKVQPLPRTIWKPLTSFLSIFNWTKVNYFVPKVRLCNNRSLGPLRCQTSSLRPFGPGLDP